jgi:Secretion system C-terminal sorting domain
MRKIYTAFLLSASFSYAAGTANAQNIFSGERVMVVGAFNGYVTTPYGTDYRTTTYRRISVAAGTPVDGRGQWATTINIQAAGGDAAPINMPGGAGNGFLFISGPAANRFQNKWVFSGIGQGTINGINNISAFNSGNDMGLNMSAQGYYSFIFNDCGYTATNGRYYVGFTSAPPVNVFRTAEIINPDASVGISISTSLATSPEENIFLRYTTGSDFSGTGASTVIQATGSGTTWSATIPSQPNGTTIRYYVFTSTRSLAQLTANTETERSLAALRYDDNAGANYQYIVTVLPVKITAFTAKTGAGRVQLRWTTELESEMDRYELLRSANGNNFEPIYTVAARNTSGTQQYTWDDVQPLEKGGYYKLAAIEKDGRQSFSTIILVNGVASSRLAIYPNPATPGDRLTINLPTALSGDCQVLLFNATGQRVATQRYPNNGNIRLLNLALPVQCSSGMYSIEVRSGAGQVFRSKLLIQ